MLHMLTKVGISNYRCFKKVEVPLAPLTVLIGPNDTGKSAFLSALQALLVHGGVSGSDLWRMEPAPLVLWADTPKGRATYGTPRTFSYTTLAFRLPSSQVVSLQANGYVDAPPSPQPSPLPLSQDGSELPALVDYLLRRDRPRFDGFVQAAKERVPGLDNIEVGTPQPHLRELVLVVENGFRVQGPMVSSGVRLLLFFLALAWNPQPADIWLIEEPENGIHPKRLAEVMSVLREVTRGVHAGKPAQVILTTHSPYVLDCVDLEKEQVLVFRRNEDGSRTAEPADKERLKTFLGEFMLGEVWFNQGEAGLVSKKG